jgi:hypothetical protein
MPAFDGFEKLLGSSEPTVIATKIKKANLTLRELVDNIIGGYLDEGMSLDIEHYLFRFVQKYQGSPEEQLILYGILRVAGFFESSKGWPDYSDCNDLSEFSQRMGFNHLEKIAKYKQIRRNGESLLLLNTNGEYQLQYFSSVEITQLMFGYLPSRTKHEYQRLDNKQKVAFEKLNQVEKMDKLMQKLLKKAFLSKEQRKQAFKTSSELKKYNDHLDSFRLHDVNFFGNEEVKGTATDEQRNESLNGYFDAILEVLVRLGTLSEQQVASVQGDIRAKMNLLDSLPDL